MRTLALLALCLFPLPGLAQTVVLIAPVFAQLVAFQPPPGFHDGDELVNGRSYLREIIPIGETVNDWTQMVSLSGGQGLASGEPATDARTFAERLGAGYSAACPDTLTSLRLDAPKVTGAQATFAAYLGCGDNGSGQSEAMVFVVMVGREDVYTLQWAEHGAVSARAPVFDPDHWYPRLTLLATGARICDRVAGEGLPYPSCTD